MAIVVVAVAGFAQPQRADAVTLPCAYDTTTTQPPVNTQNAYTYCLDKSG